MSTLVAVAGLSTTLGGLSTPIAGLSTLIGVAGLSMLNRYCEADEFKEDFNYKQNRIDTILY